MRTRNHRAGTQISTIATVGTGAPHCRRDVVRGNGMGIRIRPIAQSIHSHGWWRRYRYFADLGSPARRASIRDPDQEYLLWGAVLQNKLAEVADGSRAIITFKGEVRSKSGNKFPAILLPSGRTISRVSKSIHITGGTRNMGEYARGEIPMDVPPRHSRCLPNLTR